MNQAVMIGNVAKDPELRTTQNGTNVATFSLAVNRKKTANNPKPSADFFNVVAWRGLADICMKYLAKGRKVAVRGRIENTSYESKDGAKKYKTELIAEDIEFLIGTQNETSTHKAKKTSEEWVKHYAEQGDNDEEAEESDTGMDGFEEIDDVVLPF